MEKINLNETIDDGHPGLKVYLNMADRELKRAKYVSRPEGINFLCDGNERIHRFYGRCGRAYLSGPEKKGSAFAEYVDIIIDSITDKNREFEHDRERERKIVKWHLDKAKRMLMEIGSTEPAKSVDAIIKAFKMKEVI